MHASATPAAPEELSALLDSACFAVRPGHDGTSANTRWSATPDQDAPT